MSKSVLQFVVGLALGIALVMLVEMMGDSAETEGQIADPSVGQSLVSIEKSLSSIDESLQVVCRELADFNYSSGVTYIQPTDEAEGEDGDDATSTRKTVVPIPTETRVRHVNNKIATNWVEVIDKKLAKELVEFGLTPYDKGVGILLRRAVGELREVNNQTSKRLEEHEERWPGTTAFKSRDDPAYIRKAAERQEITQKQNDERKVVLESFRESLEQLVNGH